jgi:hypothetical protein
MGGGAVWGHAHVEAGRGQTRYSRELCSQHVSVLAEILVLPGHRRRRRNGTANRYYDQPVLWQGQGRGHQCITPVPLGEARAAPRITG